MDWLLLVQAWIAIFIVVTLHEIGHIPARIKFHFNLIPTAEAINANWREGGLVMNVFILYVVFANKPENILFQLIGLVAWIHFILYAIFGSFIPEPKDDKRGFSYWDNNKNGKWDFGEPIVNLRTYVFDDVNNKYWVIWLAAAGAVYFLFNQYYIPILQGLLT